MYAGARMNVSGGRQMQRRTGHY